MIKIEPIINLLQVGTGKYFSFFSHSIFTDAYFIQVLCSITVNTYCTHFFKNNNKWWISFRLAQWKILSSLLRFILRDTYSSHFCFEDGKNFSSQSSIELSCSICIDTLTFTLFWNKEKLWITQGIHQKIIFTLNIQNFFLHIF